MKPYETCKICEQCYSHFLRWRNDQNKSCTSWWVVQLSYSWIFHMNSFGVQNVVWICLFYIQNFEWFKQSHEKFSKIKVVDLEIYNFYVHDFFIWHHLMSENLIWTFFFFNSNFELYKQSHMKSFPKQKLDLDEFYNFYVYNISILDHLLH